MDIILADKSTFLLKNKNTKVWIDSKKNKVEAEGETVEISGPGEYEVHDVSITGLKIQNQVIYTYDLDGLRVAFLGQIKEKLNDRELDFLDGVDVLLVCGQTMEIISPIGPSLVVTPDPIKGADREPRQEKKLTINKLSLPEEMEVVILDA